MSDNKALESFQAVREIASIIVTSCESYVGIIDKIMVAETFDRGKSEALSVALMTAQVQNAALESLSSLKSSIESPYHPPLVVILALGAISSSSLLIASATSLDTLKDVPLVRVETLEQIMMSKTVDKWLQTCLGQG